ncbi:MAG: hypothetical protein GX904_01950 [Acholeplasmataceae bacterium]|nr:hypothetical protein [Acholeplasmataceae bacterium]
MSRQQRVRKVLKHNLFITFLKGLLRLFVRKPQIVGEQLPTKPSIILANHKGAAGPLVLSLYFPALFVPWGHYQMTEGYLRRFDYLYRVFYRTKLGKGKVASFILAVLFGLVSKLIYNGMHVIPSYPDLRLRRTLRISFAHLDEGNNVLVFPEDSNSGYHDVPNSFFGGFAVLAIEYYRRTKNDVPITPVFFSKPDRLIAIGESISIKSLLDQGMGRRDITKHFEVLCDTLHKKYVIDKKR